MYISYGNHNANKKTILIYYDMAFYTFYLFISINTIQESIVSPFDTLIIHDVYIWLPVLTSFHTYMSP